MSSNMVNDRLSSLGLDVKEKTFGWVIVLTEHLIRPGHLFLKKSTKVAGKQNFQKNYHYHFTITNFVYEPDFTTFEKFLINRDVPLLFKCNLLLLRQVLSVLLSFINIMPLPLHRFSSFLLVSFTIRFQCTISLPLENSRKPYGGLFSGCKERVSREQMA